MSFITCSNSSISSIPNCNLVPCRVNMWYLFNQQKSQMLLLLSCVGQMGLQKFFGGLSPQKSKMWNTTCNDDDLIHNTNNNSSSSSNDIPQFQRVNRKRFAIEDMCEWLDTHITPKQIPQCISYQRACDPLDCILIYSCVCPYTKTEYWLYVTVGFSDMFEKKNYDKNAKENGFGFEITFRLKKHPTSPQTAPHAPGTMLNQLARYVFKTSNTFSHGDFVPLSNFDTAYSYNGKVELRHILINKDPVLGECETVLGSVQYLTIVPVTDDELKYANTWFTISFLELLTQLPLNISEEDAKDQKNPLLICDIFRQSILNNSSVKLRIEQGLHKYGSGTARLIRYHIEWTLDTTTGIYTLTFPKSEEFEKVKQIVLYRIPYKRDFAAIPLGDERENAKSVAFLPSCPEEEYDHVGIEQSWTEEELRIQKSSVTHDKNMLIITMSNSFCDKFCKNEFVPGMEYRFDDCPMLVVKIDPPHQQQQ